ncbi:MAG TPA: tetratricopeptide repeat protein [Bryobacteraceae bacterium]|nr:tetratricopeptide repeat protein [Bryobacteraceae bacterium]
MHISRTEGTFLASIRAVDPANNRELAAVTVRGHAQKENQSQNLAPAKSRDYAELARVSQANAQECEGSKAALEAWYNLGVACMLVRKYDDAVPAFEKAAHLNGGKLVGDLPQECRRESAAVQARLKTAKVRDSMVTAMRDKKCQ